jgi:D-amino-acid dehydrogenase
MKSRTVAIIGAGVVGASTAYVLAKKGYQVFLIDARPKAGGGASAGNAAQLSYAYGDAMASPALLRHLPGILASRDPAFKVQWSLDPDFLAWGLRFLLNASERRWWDNTAHVLDIADQSRCELTTLLKEVDLAFDYRVAGKLHIYPDEASLAAARPTVVRKQARGLTQSILSKAEASAIEPALAHFEGRIAGAIYTPEDAVGDAAAYCRNLAAHLAERYGVVQLFDHQVVGIAPYSGRARAVRFRDREELPIDLVVIAGGPEVASLTHDVPEARAIWPVRGYSLTLPAHANAPRVSLTDVARKLAFAHLGDRFRVAGLADIGPRGKGYETERFDVLAKTARDVFPKLFAREADGDRWSGERPMTPSSQPLVQRSRRLTGLYLNIGHGMLGWTLALGTARRVADLAAEDVSI